MLPDIQIKSGKIRMHFFGGGVGSCAASKSLSISDHKSEQNLVLVVQQQL